MPLAKPGPFGAIIVMVDELKQFWGLYSIL